MIQFENELVPTKDFEAWDRAIIPVEDIKNGCKLNINIILYRKEERLVGRMKRWIEIELKNSGKQTRKIT